MAGAAAASATEAGGRTGVRLGEEGTGILVKAGKEGLLVVATWNKV